MLELGGQFAIVAMLIGALLDLFFGWRWRFDDTSDVESLMFEVLAGFLLPPTVCILLPPLFGVLLVSDVLHCVKKSSISM